MDSLQNYQTYWYNVINPTLSMLFIAQEALSLAALRNLIEVYDQRLDRALQHLDGLVGQTEDQRYRLNLSDQKRQELEDALGFDDSERQLYHQRLANWCLVPIKQVEQLWEAHPDPNEQERRSYARTHLIFHLGAAKEHQLLWQIIDETDYGKCKLQHDISVTAYKNDLLIARECLLAKAQSLEEKIRLLPQLWKYSYLISNLDSRADDYPDEYYYALARYQREETALQLLDDMQKRQRKTRLLTKLAQSLQGVHGKEAIRHKFLDRLHALHRDQIEKVILVWLKDWIFDSEENKFKHIDTLPEDQQPVHLIPLLLEPIINSAQLIEHSSYTIAIMYQTLTGYYVNFNKLDHARSLYQECLDRIEATLLDELDDFIKERLIKCLVAIACSVGFFEEAYRLANYIEDLKSRLEALSQIVKALLRTGQIEQALTLAQSIPDNDWQSRSLAAIVTKLSQSADYGQALALTKTIASPTAQGEAYSQILVNLIKADQVAAALAILDEQEKHQSKLWRPTIEALIAIGQLSQASALVEGIAEPAIRDQCFLSLVKAYLSSHELTLALNNAQKIANQSERDKAFRELCLGFGQEEQLTKAELMLQAIGSEEVRQETLSDLVALLANAQQFEEAEALAASIELNFANQIHHDNTWQGLATALAQAKGLEAALPSLKRISNHLARSEIYTQTVTHLAQKGIFVPHFPQQEVLLRSFGYHWNYAYVVNLLIQLGEFDKAFQALQTIPYRENEHGDCSKAFFQAIIQAGLLEQAHNLILSVPEAELRDSFFFHYIDLLLEHDLIEEAFALHKELSSERLEQELIAYLVQGLARTGQTDRAYSLMQHNYASHYRQSYLAIGLAQAGRFEEALARLKPIMDTPWGVNAEEAIIKELFRAGHYAQADHLAEQLTDEGSLYRVYTLSTQLLAEKGQIEQALIYSAKVPTQRDDSEVECAIAMMQAGDLEAGSKLAQTSCWYRYENIGRCVKAALQAGSLEQAHAIFRCAYDNLDHDPEQAIEEFLKALLQAGLIEYTLDLFNEHPFDRFKGDDRVEYELVAAYVRTGRRQEALDFIYQSWLADDSYVAFNLAIPLIIDYPEQASQFFDCIVWSDSQLGMPLLHNL